MARGTDIRIGPWPDGINLLDQPDQIRDTQLIRSVNLDPDNTGVLSPRRPLRYFAQDALTQTKYLLGSATLDGEVQPRAITVTYTGTDSFFKAIGSPTDTFISFAFQRAGLFKSVVQYQNKLWYIPALASSVGASSPVAQNNTLTGVAAMPYGDYGFVLKDRLFIVRKATSELFFSKATDFSVWAAPDGGVIQINPGDNSPITKVVSLNNQVIIFKRDSTFILSFTNNPTGDGVVRQVSADQGAIDAITYNNEVYCYNARSVFKFVNGFFQDIGLQLNLPGNDTIDSTAVNPARINVIGKTLMFGTTPSGKTYAMNLDTGAWTEYTWPVDLSVSTGTVFSRSALGTAIFFGDGTTKLSYMLVTKSKTQRTDQGSDSIYKAPEYAFRTKEFNFDDSETWKRVYSWHLDSTFDQAVYGTARTFINGVQNNSSTDALDLVGSSLSYRFRTTSMGYDASVINPSTSGAAVGITCRGIRATIGAKAPVST